MINSKQKKYIVGILSLLLVVTISYRFFAADKAMMLMIDGQPLGHVKNHTFVEEALQKAQNEIEKEYSAEVLGFENVLEYEEQNVENQGKLIPEEQLITSLQEKLNWKVQSQAINIDGENKVYLATEEMAYKALEIAKSRYMPEDNQQMLVEDIDFQQEVKLLRSDAYLNQLHTPETAGEFLVRGSVERVQYEVQAGDSLWSIAEANGLSFTEVQEANPGIQDFVNVGDIVELVKAQPYVTVIATIKSTVEEPIPYPTVYEYDATVYRGQTRIKQAGVNGTRKVTYRITQVNGLEKIRETLSEQIITQPVKRIAVQGTKSIEISRGGGEGGRLLWPLSGTITSGYGYRGREFHHAIDIAAPFGTPVVAAEKGVVISARWQGNYGYSIVVNHGNGLTTRYSHLSVMSVSVGTQVDRGSIIGKVGSTGRSTGPHLDFEVRTNGVSKNPLYYLR